MKDNISINPNNDGVTLTEIMVTLAVLAVLTAFAVPAIISRLPDYRLKRAARDLYSNLQKAKQEAIRLNQECAVYFDTVQNRYQIVASGPDCVCDGAPAGTPPVPKNDDILIHNIVLSHYGSGVGFGGGVAKKTVPGDPIPPDIRVSYVMDWVRFDAKGMARELGYIYLTNAEKTALAVGTPSSAGAVVQKRWMGKSWQ